jgi:hypothetical protein
MAPEVRLGFWLAAGEQAARQHTIERRRDAELVEGREKLLLRATAGQRVLDLQVDDRMRGVGTSDGVRADL